MPCFRSLCVLIVLAGCVQGADWPQWLGPKRDGSTPEKVAPWTENEPPKVLWREAVGPAYSSPVIANGRVFVHARGRDSDKEEEEVLGPGCRDGQASMEGQLRTSS